MKKLVFATGNPNKLREIKEILADLPYEILCMKDIGLDLQIEENADTFEGNALIKARALHQATGDLAIADDSGLEVDAMDKAPGVYSARFMGEDTSYEIKNAAILKNLEGKEGPERSARFVCVAAVVFPDGTEATVRGVMEGTIAKQPAGFNGFGYDPIFIAEGYDVTNSMLPPEEKNAISHRGKAIRGIRDLLLSHSEQ